MTTFYKHYSASFALAFLSLVFLAPGQAYSAEAIKVSNKPEIHSELNLDALKGSVVYVDFWASWCAPCKKSFPWLNKMQQKYADSGLKIIGVNVDRDTERAEQFLKKNPANFYSMVYDPQGKLAAKYNLIGMPSSYLIDRDGNIQHTHVGFRSSKKASYEKSIQDLLDQ